MANRTRGEAPVAVRGHALVGGERRPHMVGPRRQPQPGNSSRGQAFRDQTGRAAAKLTPTRVALASAAGGAMLEALFERIEAQRDALVDLTRELVRIPTVNPPGDAYRACARHLGKRLARSGFEVGYVRAEGVIGDSERYPRINVIARCEGVGPGPCVHFNGHIDVVEAGHGWSVDPFAGVVRDGRLYGRGSCDMKGGLAAAVIALESILARRHQIRGRARDLRHGRRGVGRLRRRRLSRRAGLVLQAPGRSRDHPRAARRGRDLPRPSRRVVGRDRDARAGSRTARCRSSASARSATWARS